MAQPARSVQAPDSAPSAVSEVKPSLISPSIDALMIGGASLLALLLMNVSLKSESPENSIARFVFNLSFVANFPHFFGSYQLLYVDFGHRIFKDLRFFWAGVVAPLLLVGILLTGFLTENLFLLGSMVNAMYFFVGWHYVKQIFGGVTVSNAMSKYFYNKIERTALKTNLFSLWAISFLGSNIGAQQFVQDGIKYTAFDFPPWTLTAAYWVLGLSGVAVIYANIHKYIREGRTPSRLAVLCLAAIYAWYLPALKHPMFMHMIPFFHSLQYLLFVYVFRRNKVKSQIDQPETPAGRKKFMWGLYGWFAVPCITGATFMYFLPRYLDTLNLIDSEIFGPIAFYFSFMIFINIHHYFIDNVIWRGNNPEMKQFLFAPASAVTPAQKAA